MNVAFKPSISMAAPPAANPQGPLARNLSLLTPLPTFVLALAAVLFAVILSEAGVLSARRLYVRWGGEAKNLSLHEWGGEKFYSVRRGFLRITHGRAFSPAALAAFALAIVLAVGLISCSGTTNRSASASGGGTTGTTGGTSGNGGSGGTGGGGTGGGGSVTIQFTVQAQSGSTTANLGTVSITVP